MEPNQTATEPTPTQTTEPTPTEPAAPVEPAVNDPAPATFAQQPSGQAVQAPDAPAAPAQPTEPQQTTEPQSPTEPEPTEPTEPTEPVVRVVPKPSEYTLPEGTPDQIRIFAHEKGFTQEQLDATLQEFAGYTHGMQQYEQTALRQLGEAHLKSWGAEAKTKLALAKQALNQNDPEGKLSKALNESGYGNHPAVLDFLYTLGKSMQEGGFIKSAIPRPPGKKTAAAAMYGDNHPTEG